LVIAFIFLFFRHFVVLGRRWFVFCLIKTLL